MNQKEWSPAFLCRIVGYTLLLLAIFDFIEILTPLQIKNPAWGFGLVGSLIERVPVPLLGLLLVFYGGPSSLGRWGKVIVKFLSWFALAAGIFYILLIPVALGNTWRLNNLNNSQINTQVSQQQTQIEQYKTQLNTATAQELEALFKQLNPQGRAQISSPEELKTRLATEIEKADRRLRTESETARKNRRLALLKNSIKWTLGALISGVVLIYMWQSTSWAREKRGRRKPPSVSPS
ncbi:MAG: HpsJ family protein [Leptolyngbyaceae bacterium]|nr:HpsJ family protein [Leptolyngbyaceae bacterium]